MMRLFLVAFMIFVLVGCAPTTVRKKSRARRIAETPIFCESGDDCEIKWGRAITWITTKSHWKIKTQSDSLITTHGPGDTLKAAYIVQKVPLGQNRYEITIRLWCGNPLGCHPGLIKLKKKFVIFILGEVPNVDTEPVGESK